MVAGVCDPDAILFIDGHGLRPHELARGIAVTAPLHQERSRRTEFLDPIELAVFGHIIVALRIFHDIRHEIEFAGRGTALAADRAVFEQRAVGFVKQDAEVMRVGDADAPLAID